MIRNDSSLICPALEADKLKNVPEVIWLRDCLQEVDNSFKNGERIWL